MQETFTPEEIKGLEFNYVLYYPFHGKETQWLKIYSLVEARIQALKNTGDYHLELKPYSTRFDKIDRELVVLLNEFFTAITRTKLCLVIVEAKNERLKELYHYLSASIDQIQQNAIETPWSTPEITIEDWRNDYKALMKQDNNDEAIANFSKQLEKAMTGEKDPEKRKAFKEISDTIQISQQTPQLIKYIQLNQEQKTYLFLQDNPALDLTQSFAIGRQKYDSYIDYLMQCGGTISVNVVKAIALHAKQHLVHDVKGTCLLQWMLARREQDKTFATAIDEVLAEQVKLHGNVFTSELFKAVVQQHKDPAIAYYLFSWMEKNISYAEEIINDLRVAVVEIEKKPNKAKEWNNLGKLVNEYLQSLKKHAPHAQTRVAENHTNIKNQKAAPSTASQGFFSTTSKQPLTTAGVEYLKKNFAEPLLKKSLSSGEENKLIKSLQKLFNSPQCQEYFEANVEININKGKLIFNLKNNLLSNITTLPLLCGLITKENEAVIGKIIGWDVLIQSINIPKIKNECFSNLLNFGARNGNLNIVKLLFEQGLILNNTSSRMNLPLLLAAQNGHLEIVKLLIEKKADINIIGFNGTTPLYMAAQQGYVEIVEVLIGEKNLNINQTANDGTTPLYMAAQNRHVEVVKLLIEKKADVNKATRDGATPLFMAAQEGYVELVELLIKNKADVNKAISDGTTPLYMGAQNGRVETVKLLLDHGALVNQAVSDGATPLFIASQNGHLEIVKLLIEKKADVNKATNNGGTPLFIAAQNGHVKIVELLIEQHADVNKTISEGATPLFIAAQNGQVKIVELLIEKYADVNKAISDGTSPLIAAIQDGHVKIVELLIEKHADINKAKSDGATPLFVAAQQGHLKIVELLIAKKVDINQAKKNGTIPLFIAAEKGHADVVELLTKNKADINQANNDGVTPLFIAAQKGHTKIVETLLSCGADITATFTSTYAGLLSFAKKHNVEKNMKDFINKQPNINKIKITALDIAIIMGHEEIVLKIKGEPNFAPIL